MDNFLLFETFQPHVRHPNSNLSRPPRFSFEHSCRLSLFLQFSSSEFTYSWKAILTNPRCRWRHRLSFVQKSIHTIWQGLSSAVDYHVFEYGLGGFITNDFDPRSQLVTLAYKLSDAARSDVRYHCYFSTNRSSRFRTKSQTRQSRFSILSTANRKSP